MLKNFTQVTNSIFFLENRQTNLPQTNQRFEPIYQYERVIDRKSHQNLRKFYPLPNLIFERPLMSDNKHFKFFNSTF